jgi:transposase
MVHDRDINAAINLKHLRLERSEIKQVERVKSPWFYQVRLSLKLEATAL